MKFLTSLFCFSETMATPTAKKNDGFKKKNIISIHMWQILQLD